mmetsp:Transcript_49129/g.76631  ORF Transcript_49129/g.76631 Transcript_49129/m.76631 type:complete len:90 (-) Transcript_49129:159-428(-)
MQPDEEPGRSGMFRFASRLNHSCESNVSWSYFEDSDTLFSVATRDIGVAEELLVNYFPGTSTSKGLEKEEYLLRYYGFRCGCSECTEDQ